MTSLITEQLCTILIVFIIIWHICKLVQLSHNTILIMKVILIVALLLIMASYLLPITGLTSLGHPLFV